MTEPATPETIKQIRAAIEEGGVILTQDQYAGQMYIFRGGYMWFVNMDGKGIIKTAATMRDQLFEMHMIIKIVPPKVEDVKPLPENMKDEVEKKLTGKIEDYMEMVKQGKLRGGGGMTTEMSFTVDLRTGNPEDTAKAEDFIRSVLNPESFGFFIFH